MALIGFLDRLVRRVLHLKPRRQFVRVHLVPELHDVPELLDSKTVYVAGSLELPKWAVLTCPCPRHHPVTLSLQRPHRVWWSIRQGDGGPTIHPSIDVQAEERCHYWVRDGRVTWVGVR
jgi:hypothetical protein